MNEQFTKANETIEKNSQHSTFFKKVRQFSKKKPVSYL